MLIKEAKVRFGYGKPILKEDLKPYINTKSENTFNQTISNLVKFEIVKRVSNGIYYFPHEEEPFKDLEPDIKDIIAIKYLDNYSGIRAGSFLAYKYKLTSQVSGYYEIITNNVSKNTRGKKEYDGKVIVKASKFKVNKENIKYLEFLELLNNIKYSDYNYDETLKKLNKIFKDLKLDNNKILKVSKYYDGNVNKKIRDMVQEIIYKNTW